MLPLVGSVNYICEAIERRPDVRLAEPVATGTIIIAGIEVPSGSPLFLAVVGFHVLVGAVAVIAGIATMLSKKQPGRHPRFHSLPLWRDLPTIAYWLVPGAIGVPLIVYTLSRHPLMRQ
jgi:hypothetical protein